MLYTFIKKCNSKVSWASTSLQIAKHKKKKKEKGGEKPQNKTKTKEYTQNKKKKNFEKFSVLKNGPQKMRK